MCHRSLAWLCQNSPRKGGLDNRHKTFCSFSGSTETSESLWYLQRQTKSLIDFLTSNTLNHETFRPTARLRTLNYWLKMFLQRGSDVHKHSTALLCNLLFDFPSHKLLNISFTFLIHHCFLFGQLTAAIIRAPLRSRGIVMLFDSIPFSIKRLSLTQY